MDHGRILVVDDNAVIAKCLQFALTNRGFEVEVATNGLEAWNRVQNEQFDLVITDIRMPEMTGIEFCSQLRTLEGYQFTPIVIETGFAADMDPAVFQELGIAEMINKPFNPSDLAQSVEKCLAASEPV